MWSNYSKCKNPRSNVLETVISWAGADLQSYINVEPESYIFTPFGRPVQYFISILRKRYDLHKSKYELGFEVTNTVRIPIVFRYTNENWHSLHELLQVEFPDLSFSEPIPPHCDYDELGSLSRYIPDYVMKIYFKELEVKTCRCGYEFCSKKEKCEKCVRHIEDRKRWAREEEEDEEEKRKIRKKEDEEQDRIRKKEEVEEWKRGGMWY